MKRIKRTGLCMFIILAAVILCSSLVCAVCTDADADGFGDYGSTLTDCIYTHAYDCDDGDADILPPYDDMSLTADTILCNGTYYINDSGSSGVVRIGANDINLTCNGTEIVGNASGYGLYTNNRDRLVVSGCNVSNYSIGFYVTGTTDSWFYNITARDTADLGNGFYCVSSGDRNNITDSRFIGNSGIQGYGLWLSSCDDCNIWNVTAYGNDDGIYLLSSFRADLRDIVAFDNAYDGIGLNGAGSSFLRGIYSFENGVWGLDMDNADDTVFMDMEFVNNSAGGFFVYRSYNMMMHDVYSHENGVGGQFRTFNDGSRIENSTFHNNTNYGVFLQGGDKVNFTNVTVSDNDYGFYFYNYLSSYPDDNVIKNSTMVDNGVYGVWVNAGSNNVIYHNNFTNNGVDHAQGTVATNHFNITNTAKAAGYRAEGNYWDGILALGIYDSNADGFGDSGPEYPYTSGFNVDDYGPITSRPPPFASMTIVGPNGTELTGTRNVYLNITYYMSNLDVCRWANDAESNLASAPWEPCTTVKAWVLSAGDGNKSVYMEVLLDDLRAQNKTDSIIYRYTQDYTPPEDVMVLDGRDDDIDWWNSNITLHAHWSATEDISRIYYRYRLLNDSDHYAGSPVWTDAGTDNSVKLTGLSLEEGWNMSFEVMAYNPFGLNATPVTSDGAVIDITRPDRPSVTSSTHPDQNTPSPSPAAVFNFTAADPISSSVASGVEGYSYLLDKHPGTAPDNDMEERYWETLNEMHKGFYNQTLKVNGSGAGDLAYAVFTQLHNNITENESIRVKVALAEQFSDYADLMGVKVYLAELPNNAVVGDFDYSTMESNAVTNIANVSQDIMYVEEMDDAYVYTFDLEVNRTVNDNTDDVYVVVAGIDTDDDNRQPLAIGGTTNPAVIDSDTKNFVCGENDVCRENTTTLEYAIKVERQDSGDDWSVQYDYLGDDIYYFHVKARDRAGNWGDASHYRIMVAAGGVSSIIYSPVDGEVFRSEGDKNITVKVSVSDNASVYVVALHPDGSNFTSDPFIFNRSHEFENITLELGENEIYAVTNSTSGAIAHSPHIFVTVSAELQPFMDKTLRVEYTGCSATALPYLCNRDETDVYVGVATETLGSISEPAVQADTSQNSMKLYVTRPFDTATIADQFKSDTFLDRTNPMFGYTRSADYYVLRNELRYYDINLGGSFYVTPGTYQLYIRKTGVTPDGRYNITLSIG